MRTVATSVLLCCVFASVLPSQVVEPVDLTRRDGVQEAVLNELMSQLLRQKLNAIAELSTERADEAPSQFTDQKAVNGVVTVGQPTPIGSPTPFTNACGSDGLYWTAQSATIFCTLSDPIVWFEMDFVSTVDNSATMEVAVEASKESVQAVLFLRALLYNFRLGQFDALGTTVLTTTDTTTTFLPPGAPADYIDPNTGVIKLLLQTIKVSGVSAVDTQLDDVRIRMFP